MKVKHKKEHQLKLFDIPIDWSKWDSLVEKAQKKVNTANNV